jgi:DNA-binding response OmpR family regulator
MNDTTATATVLVVEDDPDVREVVMMTLQAAGYRTIGAVDGAEGVERALRDEPDLVVLDVMMPKKTGLEALAEIRATSPVPAILLTSLGDERSKVKGLELGADDYVVKPFSPAELLARIGALLRRSTMAPAASAPTIVHDDLCIDTGARVVLVAGARVDTTAKEFDLLAFLASSPGRVFTRHQLLRAVWRSSSEWQQEATVTEHVRRLRLKIEANPDQPRWLETVRGVGYRFAGARDRGNPVRP